MKRVLIMLSMLFLTILFGCARGNMEPTGPDFSATVQETVLETEAHITIETTIPTETETVPPDPLELLLEQMTLEERVGQLFLTACPDTEVLEAISDYHLGGFILFQKDVEGETPDSLRQFLSEYQSTSQIPMLIAVDEEGGSVCRISAEAAFRSSRFSSPGYLLEQGGLEQLLQTEEEKCQLLKKLGINVNLAPVCDIATDANAFMYFRSFRQSPEQTSESVRAVVAVMNQQQVGCVLKHFPGYGNNTDTHVAMALDERSLESLEQSDLLPFQAGIAAGAGAVMVSHTIVTALDADMPASLSTAVHTYLREKMGFDGVIMTDDLKMAAITDAFGDGEAAVLAVLAGNDVLCTWEFEVQYAAVLEAVRTGRIPTQQLDASVLRILRWKQNLGLLEN